MIDDAGLAGRRVLKLSSGASLRRTSTGHGRGPSSSAVPGSSTCPRTRRSPCRARATAASARLARSPRAAARGARRHRVNDSLIATASQTNRRARDFRREMRKEVHRRVPKRKVSGHAAGSVERDDEADGARGAVEDGERPWLAVVADPKSVFDRVVARRPSLSVTVTSTRTATPLRSGTWAAGERRRGPDRAIAASVPSASVRVMARLLLSAGLAPSVIPRPRRRALSAASGGRRPSRADSPTSGRSWYPSPLRP